MGVRVATGGDLLAAAVADPQRGRVLGAQLATQWVGARHGLRMQRPVEQRQRLGDRRVGRLPVAYGLAQPALSLLARIERFRRPHGGHPGKRGRRRLGPGLASPRFAPPAPQHGGRGDGFDHQHPLTRLVASEVAAVRKSELAGELELDESEELAQLPLCPSGSANRDGAVRTRGFWMPSSRLVSRSHCFGPSRALNSSPKAPPSGR